jgi:HPt (histidine-containing phosphotransfer) domain-containing protein
MSTAAVDPQKLRELTEMTDSEFVQELISAYLEDAPEQILEMRQALETEEQQRFARAAHSLKSTSANLGASMLQQYAKELEAYGRAGDLAAAAEQFPRLEEEYARVEAQLGAWGDD